ncbi:hypothetical protein ACFL54_09790, partial [Planctomycetota bacterium]
VVLGVLALLSVLAITFVSMTRLERSISRNYVDRTHAIMAAESGIEAAVNRIASWHGTLTPAMMKDLEYNPSNPNADLKDAAQPSFASPGAPPPGIAGQVSGFVGPGTYIMGGDYYKLKVKDESGKLNLNDSNNLIDPDDNCTGRLSSIIENLAEVLHAADYGPGIGTVVAGRIMQARKELGQFVELSQVREALITAGITDKFEQDRFLDNVTLWSWRDPNTIKPSPAFRGDDTTGGPSGNGFHQDPGNFNYPATEAQLSGSGSLEEQLDEIYGDDIYMNSQFQHKGLELEPRSPVNINTASLQLIKSLLIGIQGGYVYEYGHENIYRFIRGYTGNRIGLSLNALLNYPLLYDKAPMPMHLADRGKGCPHTPPPRTLVPEWIVFYSNLYKGGNGARVVLPYPDQRRYEMYRLSESLDPNLNFLGNGFGSVRRTVAIDEDLAHDLAQALYDRIHFDSSCFGSWQEFKRFIYEYFDYYGNYYYDMVYYTSRYHDWYNCINYCFNFADSECNRDLLRPGLNNKFLADAVIANFCPNADLNDFNPNATLFRCIDKNDLLHYTTEFCFEPTGTFSICSEGYIAGNESDLLARQEIQAIIKVFETARITTQAQFFPEPADTMIANQHQYFGSNQTSIRTSGMDSDIACPSWGNGPLTQCYPEPLILDEAARIAQAHYDGYVCLAANQAEDLLGSSGVFRVSFNGTLDADQANGDPSLAEDCNDPAWAEHTEHPTTNRLLFTPKDAADYLDSEGKKLQPGNLYVDGGYSEAYQTLMYHSVNNFGSNNGKKGSLLFWLKPNFQPERSSRPRTFFSMNNMNKTHQEYGDRYGYNTAKIPPESIGSTTNYTGGFSL